MKFMVRSLEDLDASWIISWKARVKNQKWFCNEKKRKKSVLINSNGIHLDEKKFIFNEKLNEKKFKEIQIKSHSLWTLKLLSARFAN